MDVDNLSLDFLNEDPVRIFIKNNNLVDFFNYLDEDNFFL